jgi:transposase
MIWLVVLLAHIAVVQSVLPTYLPNPQENYERDDLIVKYFRLGMKYTEILMFLASVHGIQLSLRQLKRVVTKRGLSRRKNYSSTDEVVQAVERELNSSGNSIGYRAMHQRLQTDYGLVVRKDAVRRVLRVLDPEGVEARLRHRLRRRTYRGKGPNRTWHIDGYDKLKPFGFCIHGCIDGYSRRIMWLEVGPSNNNPAIICQYFLDCVKQVNCTPQIIRSDKGTENTNIAAVQRFFRRAHHDEFAGNRSFVYGKSVSNQRIEAWWSFLRRECADWWINYFKNARERGIYNDGNNIHVECLKFCFSDLIQKELYRVARLWNLHKIRPSTNADSPHGRPDTMYYMPMATATRDYGSRVSEEDIEVAIEMCAVQRPISGCSREFNQLAEIIMEENGLVQPNNKDEAEQLYLILLRLIEIENTFC